MHPTPWVLYSAITVLAQGVVDLLQKLSTNHLSAESSLIWLVMGFLVIEPLFYPSKGLLRFSKWSIA